MWLIEFFEGHLQGVTLPIDSGLALTGAASDRPDVLCLPEYLDESTRWELQIASDKPVITGVTPNRTQVLVANRIYSFKGLCFFVYREGKRSPRMQSYKLKQHWLLFVVSVLVNVALVIGLYTGLQKNQESQFAAHISKLGTGYIKDGKLYVPDKTALSDLPPVWQESIVQIEKGAYAQVSQPNVAVVSDNSDRPLEVTIVEKSDHDEIRVQTFETENRIMALFGQSGITFSRENKDGGTWFVSDRAKAVQILKDNGLEQVTKYLETHQDSSAIVNASDFPYSIFYSSATGGYLYDQKNRYWEGSEVPGLGIIESISSDRVTFKQGEDTRVYFIEQ